jgi:DNA invertase Pin-like site-specific DNA recombinase
MTSSASTSGRYVAIYCRISDDRNGRGENVENQEGWGRAYAAEQWPNLPVRVYVDNDLSASKRHVRLPERERLRRDLAAGEIAQVWTVEQSRLQRRETDWFALADEFEDAGVTHLHTQRDGVRHVRDLAASIQAILNAEEARKLSKRVRDDMAEHARAGGIPGGTVYRYKRIAENGVKRLAIVPEQAAIIREIAERILAGETQTAIANDLHARGIVGPRGGRIWQSTVHSMVTNHTVAGKRVHDPGNTGKGVVYPGSWEPILDEATWQRVRDRIGETKIGRWKSTRPERYRYDTLLSGIITCADCPKGGSAYAMVATNKLERRAAGSTARTLYYACRLCGRGINARAVDAYVEARLLDRLDGLVDLRTPVDKWRHDKIKAELERIRRDRETWGVMLADGTMTTDTYVAAEARAAERVRALEAELRDLPTPDETLSADAVRIGWDGGTIHERREIIGRFTTRVSVAAAPPGFRGNAPALDKRLTVDGQGWEDAGRLAHAGALLRLGYDRYKQALASLERDGVFGMSDAEQVAVIDRLLAVEAPSPGSLFGPVSRLW